MSESTEPDQKLSFVSGIYNATIMRMPVVVVLVVGALVAFFGYHIQYFDFDDGTVGVKDLLILLGNWGPCP